MAAEPAGEKLIDVRTFWQAVGLRAVGAAVVTAQGSEGPRGFLALSATHLCADPPMMMVSVDKKTSALAAIQEAGHFAINYLALGQEEIASTFGGRGELKGADRFTNANWGRLATGAPVLQGASGVLDCRLEETIERYGTIIAIGRLVDFAAAEAARPLVYYRGGVL